MSTVTGLPSFHAKQRAWDGAVVCCRLDRFSRGKISGDRRNAQSEIWLTGSERRRVQRNGARREEKIPARRGEAS
jgi:hypothetical protein